MTEFIMPNPAVHEPIPLVTFGLDALNHIVRADDGRAGFLRFVPSRRPGGAATIPAADLFDTAMAELLATIGAAPVGDEGALQPAINALQAARVGPSPEGKAYHRRGAAELLVGVCREYEAAIAGPATYRTAFNRQHRFLRLFPRFGTVVTLAFRSRATVIALVIAVMYRRGGEPAATPWANHARTHFAEYERMALALIASEISSEAHSEHGSVGKLKKRYRERHFDMPRQAEQFQALYAWLIAR